MGRSVVTTQDLCGFLRNREDMPFTARQSDHRSWVLDILDVGPDQDGKLFLESECDWIDFGVLLVQQEIDGFYIEPDHPMGCVVQFT